MGFLKYYYLFAVIIMASAVAFAVGTVSIQSPANTTYNYTNISLTFTFTEGADTCWYNYDTANITLTNCTNATFLAVPNAHTTITVFLDDLGVIQEDCNSC